MNGVLNLLRRQTEDVGTEDRRREGASSLAGSGAGHGVTAAATENPSANTSATSASLRFVSANDGIDWARVVRISAIHACVDRKDTGALPELRKAAIHAIGQLGTAEDMALLDSLPQADGKVS